MRSRIVKFLECPIDRGPLSLQVWESSKTTFEDSALTRLDLTEDAAEEFEEEIITGALLNERLGVYYPIFEGVPRLLCFDNPVFQKFLEKKLPWVRMKIADDFSLPTKQAYPGETDIFASFSREWVDYDWDGKSYWGQEAEITIKSMHHLLQLDAFPVRGKKVLEVGIGAGATANSIADEHGAEVFGLDLSMAVDVAFRHFSRRNPFFHVVQGSLFRIPLKERAFDLVYSHGVIHHTFSTKKAFERINRYPKLGGSLCWVIF